MFDMKNLNIQRQFFLRSELGQKKRPLIGRLYTRSANKRPVFGGKLLKLTTYLIVKWVITIGSVQVLSSES